MLGFSAKETAETLETSVASVNSALQRARATLERRLPERSQQATLRELGDEEVGALVERYLKAWERNDVEGVVSMLSADAAFAMPPLRDWFGGREAIGLSPPRRGSRRSCAGFRRAARGPVSAGPDQPR